mgnify:CR=1 FL=1
MKPLTTLFGLDRDMVFLHDVAALVKLTESGRTYLIEKISGQYVSLELPVRPQKDCESCDGRGKKTKEVELP